MNTNNKNRKKRNDKMVIVLAAIAAVIVIAAVAAVIVGKGKSGEDAQVAAVQEGQDSADGKDGYVEVESGVYVNADGEILDDNAVRELADGENPEDVEVQVKTSADYVEPGKGTLNIDKIQGFTAKTGSSDSNTSSGKSGNSEDKEDRNNTDGEEDENAVTDTSGTQENEETSGGNQNGDGQNGGETAGDDKTDNSSTENRENGDDSEQNRETGDDSEQNRETGDGSEEGNKNDGKDTGTSLDTSRGTALSDSNLTVNAVGSYTGSFLEDGSDTPVSDVASILITNNSSQMLQVSQITFQVSDTETAVFRVTDLPAGTSALVMEQNRRQYKESDDYSYGNTATAYIDTPSLENEKFDIEMESGKVRLNNKTGESYSKVYVYYKYVQLGGAYKGGITYRTPVENIPANGSAEATAGHMNPDTTQIVDVRIIE